MESGRLEAHVQLNGLGEWPLSTREVFETSGTGARLNDEGSRRRDPLRKFWVVVPDAQCDTRGQVPAEI